MITLPNMTFEKIVIKTKLMLGKNYKEPEIPEISDEEIETITTLSESDNAEEVVNDALGTDLEEICAMVIREAAEWTNRYREEQITEMMNNCWPVIVKCSCMAYLNRGAEGLNSQSELGQQNVYNDWVTLMHRQLTNRRYVV